MRDSVVLFAAESGLSQAIDAFSGADGYSHCGLVLDGQFWDTTLNDGVGRRSLDVYKGRPRTFVDVSLDDVERDRAKRKAAALDGRCFELAGLGARSAGRLTCTTFVLQVLPLRVFESVVRVCSEPHRCKPLSPNDIAAAYGVSPASAFARAS